MADPVQVQLTEEVVDLSSQISASSSIGDNLNVIEAKLKEITTPEARAKALKTLLESDVFGTWVTSNLSAESSLGSSHVVGDDEQQGLLLISPNAPRGLAVSDVCARLVCLHAQNVSLNSGARIKLATKLMNLLSAHHYISKNRTNEMRKKAAGATAGTVVAGLFVSGGLGSLVSLVLGPLVYQGWKRMENDAEGRDDFVSQLLALMLDGTEGSAESLNFTSGRAMLGRDSDVVALAKHVIEKVVNGPQNPGLSAYILQNMLDEGHGLHQLFRIQRNLMGAPASTGVLSKAPVYLQNAMSQCVTNILREQSGNSPVRMPSSVKQALQTYQLKQLVNDIKCVLDNYDGKERGQIITTLKGCVDAALENSGQLDNRFDALLDGVKQAATSAYQAKDGGHINRFFTPSAPSLSEFSMSDMLGFRDLSLSKYEARASNLGNSLVEVLTNVGLDVSASAVREQARPSQGVAASPV
jgi:hypothetical protein